jgi:mono/diheme cytochrome c family protein
MKFTARAILSLLPFILLVSSLGCDRKIGPPNDQDELMRPENVASFDRLYKQNCSGCHGENGSGGPALDLANPKYQALVDDVSLRRRITSGMPGTQMPAFGESAGGFLIPLQVDVLVAGMRTRWDHKDHEAADMPPYSSSTVGNSNTDRISSDSVAHLAISKGSKRLPTPAICRS